MKSPIMLISGFKTFAALAPAPPRLGCGPLAGVAIAEVGAGVGATGCCCAAAADCAPASDVAAGCPDGAAAGAAWLFNNRTCPSSAITRSSNSRILCINAALSALPPGAFVACANRKQRQKYKKGKNNPQGTSHSCSPQTNIHNGTATGVSARWIWCSRSLIGVQWIKTRGECPNRFSRPKLSDQLWHLHDTGQQMSILSSNKRIGSRRMLKIRILSQVGRGNPDHAINSICSRAIALPTLIRCTNPIEHNLLRGVARRRRVISRKS